MVKLSTPMDAVRLKTTEPNNSKHRSRATAAAAATENRKPHACVTPACCNITDVIQQASKQAHEFEFEKRLKSQCLLMAARANCWNHATICGDLMDSTCKHMP